MRRLLGLYPSAWQRRYRREVEAHLAAEPVRVGTMANLVAGAIDAWANSDWIPVSNDDETTGEMAMTDVTGKTCFGSLVFYEEKAPRSAALMIGVSLLVTAFGVFLDKTYGDHLLIDALLVSGFFIALTISSGPHLERTVYSPIARIGFVASVCAAWYGFFLGVLAVAALV